MSRILVAAAIQALAIIVTLEEVRAFVDVRRWIGLRTTVGASKQPLGMTMQVAVITVVMEALEALAVTLIAPHLTMAMDLMLTSRLAVTIMTAMVIRER